MCVVSVLCAGPTGAGHQAILAQVIGCVEDVLLEGGWISKVSSLGWDRLSVCLLCVLRTRKDPRQATCPKSLRYS